MKEYMAIMNSMWGTQTKRFRAENLRQARLLAFQWACDSSGDRLEDVELVELKGTISLDGELNPARHSAMYYTANLDYETGKRRTAAKRKAVRQEKEHHEADILQRLLDEDDETAVPYSEMLYKDRIISRAELVAIKNKFQKCEKMC